jgi:hypothetical protein
MLEAVLFAIRARISYAIAQFLNHEWKEMT